MSEAQTTHGHRLWVIHPTKIYSDQMDNVGQVEEVKILKQTFVKGQLGVPLTVYPWYLLRSLWILGLFDPINTHYIYRAYIGISHRGTLVGVHPSVP